ncbi:solute carrier family 25 member 10, partial [Chelydra serpentina]
GVARLRPGGAAPRRPGKRIAPRGPARWRRSACPAGTSGAWPRAAPPAAPTRWTCSRFTCRRSRR